MDLLASVPNQTAASQSEIHRVPAALFRGAAARR